MAERGLTALNWGPGVRAYFTTAEFDLATPAGREGLAGQIGLPLVFANQVHGRDVCWVEEPTPKPDAFATADVLATATDGIGLVIRTADCVPVLLADPEQGLVAAVHVGWRGLMAGIVAVALDELRARGALHPRAAVGPAICGRCYEVDEDLAGAAAGQGHVVNRGADGRPRLDLAASVVNQLRRGGTAGIWLLPECTRESEQLFSWRGQRASGRQGGVIALSGDAPTAALRPEPGS